MGDLSLSYQPTSGLLASSSLGTVNDSFGYNRFAELQSYGVNVGATPLFQTSYARDALGRITILTETITNTTVIYLYGYDTAGRLATVKRNGTQIASYSYDANGNRLTATDSSGNNSASYDNQDRLLSYGNATYSYTANGELTSKKVTSAGTVTDPVEVTTYSYDEFGNLLSVKLPNNDTISYLIDGKDRRIGRKVNGVLQKGWLYEDQLRPVAELDNTGAVTSRFVYATRINVPDYMVKGGVTYRLILDHLGSVRLVVNSQTGEVVQRMDYDAWGAVTKDTNPGFQPFGFAGGLWDGQTGLVRFGARDYDAKVGRWTGKDPIGFAGGDGNLYAYSMHNPLNRADPTGLDTITYGVTINIPGILVDLGQTVFGGEDIPGGRSLSVGIAASFPGLWGGEWDSGVYGQIGVSKDVGLQGRLSEDFGYHRGSICDLAGQSGNVSMHYGLLGGSIDIDEVGLSGVSINVGPGYDISAGGTIGKVFSRRWGWIDDPQKCTCKS